MAIIQTVAITVSAVVGFVLFVRYVIQAGGFFRFRRWAKRVDLSGKRIAVTGANAGLGYSTVEQLAQWGAHVTLLCRSVARGQAALQDIRNSNRTTFPEVGSRLEVEELDLGWLDSIRSYVARLKRSGYRLDVLVGNAGVMVPSGDRTADGFPAMFGVNHVGHFFLVDQLLRENLLAPNARLVILSSEASAGGVWDPADISMASSRFTGAIGGMRGYNTSKLYNALYVAELQRRLAARRSDVAVFAVNPGFCWSELDTYQRGVIRVLLRAVRRLIAKPTAFGAQTMLHCASAPGLAAHSGAYFSECRPFRVPNKLAYRDDVRERLWAFTVEQLRLRMPTWTPAV
jgi:NAD(P)-dependent dehydrogenase (short-subunit alcohol dehydrogenase family)